MVKVLVCEAENARSIRAIYQKREYSLGGRILACRAWDMSSTLITLKPPTWRNGIRGGLKILFLSVQVRWWVFFFLKKNGTSPSGKAVAFEATMRRFESCRPNKPSK